MCHQLHNQQQLAKNLLHNEYRFVKRESSTHEKKGDNDELKALNSHGVIKEEEEEEEAIKSSTTHTEKNLCNFIYRKKRLYIYIEEIKVIDLFESESQTYKGNCRICFNIFFNIHISLMLDKKKYTNTHSQRSFY